MNTNDVPLVWPLSLEERARIYREARAERARAISALSRSMVAAVKRAFRRNRQTAIWVPAAKSRPAA
ncbi:MAG: hypothetical protein AB7F35_03895 [Acetobacteraceae bacterium]